MTKIFCKSCQFESGHSFECPLYQEQTPYGECPKCHELLTTDEEKSENMCENCVDDFGVCNRCQEVRLLDKWERCKDCQINK